MVEQDGSGLMCCVGIISTCKETQPEARLQVP